MAVRIKFDRSHNVIQPTIVLATRSGKKLGVIQAENIEVSDSMNTYFELSFQVQKESNGQRCILWDQIEDLKLVWCREWDVWFEIQVETSESNNTVKNINAISLGEAELGQVMLYGIEINTENDIAREEYDADNPTVLYRDDLHSSSLLHRIMEKVPHYTIKHVDVSIRNIQRTFTFDGTSLYDAFQQIAEEINCIFVINSGTNAEGEIAREISIYDLESYCVDCGHRDTYFKTCPNPKCTGDRTNVLTGYGEDTTIFISTENLAENIVYSTDKDSVKNCFKLEGGDDLMTATIANCNPNGSGYIWYLSDLMKRDMSDELVEKLNEYDKNYDYYQNEHKSVITGSKLTNYNTLIEKYFKYNDKLEKIPETIIGYPALMTAYYNTIDFYLYLKSGLMPDVKMQDTKANLEANNLKNKLSSSTVSVQNLNSCSSSTASSAVLAMAKIIIDSRYQVKVKDGVLSTTKDNDGNVTNATWTGNFTITNYSDEEDTATSENITVKIDGNYEGYVEQKLEKALSSNEFDGTYGIVSIFKLSLENFKKEIKKYCLSSLESFRDACQTCLDILIEQGISNNETWADKNPNLYEKLYLQYYHKNSALLEEIKLREEEIIVISGKRDINGNIVTSGLQNLIESEQIKIQNELNFEKYLGDKLWLEFVAYRREDTYSNSNYISEGLDNKKLFEYALEFIEVARKEIYKSATLQHSITATLKNLLVMKEFEPIVRYFSVGNWIRVRINDEIYRLRLISYTIDFENLDNISIEFSDVLQCVNGVSDVESILNQASSMATSYGSVQNQASKGKKSNDQLNDWVEKGLSLTNMKIVSGSDNQSITIDDHGLLGREYLPLTDTYDDKQLKIINKGLYLTDDNWLTSKAGIGNFVYWNPMTKETEEAYGVIADTLIGNLILSENVGIYNPNNSITLDKNGLIITANEDIANNNKNDLLFTIQKEVIDANGNKSTQKLLYIDDNGNLVFHGSISIFSGSSTSNSLDSVINDIDSLGNEIKALDEAIEGMDGLFFFIKYSDNADGNPMYNSPTETTKYMGTCSTNVDKAPTEPSEYTWCLIKGADGENGTAGIDGKDGKSQYFHVKYSNDGETFTENNGETLGDWMGTCITEEEKDPMDFDAYTWHKIKGETGTAGLDGKDGIAGESGKDGKTTYFHVKYSSVENPTTSNEMTEVPSKYIGTYVDFVEEDSTDPLRYTWVQFMGKDGIDGKDGQNGIPGTNGEDGKTYYLHIKYSNDGGETFTENNGEESGEYIGVYTDTIEADSLEVSKYKWSLIKGEDGTDGTTYYTWIKYADTPTSGMSDIPEGKTYMGIAYNKTEQKESENYSDYNWSLIKGEDGSDGVNGVDGADGKTYYTWVKYADDEIGTNMSDDPEGKFYIGLAYNKENSNESNNASDYTWSLFRGSDGIDGKDGKDGTTYYTWIKYADTPTSGMSNDPEGKTYMGIAYNKTDKTESTNYSDYIWSLIKGEDGSDGINGIDGIDGKTYYTWVKYADDVNGTNMSNDPEGKFYIGIAYNKESPTESNNVSDYTWSLFRGSDGIDGKDGANGISTYFYVRYSENSNGNPMTTLPIDKTKYMGVCSTTSPTAPTNYEDYDWTQCKGSDGTAGTPGVKGEDGKTQYLHIKYSDDGKTFTKSSKMLENITVNKGYDLAISGEVKSNSDTTRVVSNPISVNVGEEYSINASAFSENALFVLYDASGNVVDYRQADSTEESEIIESYVLIVPENVTTMRVASCTTIQDGGFKVSSMVVDGEELGAYIGTFVDFEEMDSMNFNDYTWKKFTEDVDEELADLADQIENNKNDLYGAIDNAVNDMNTSIDGKFEGVNADITGLKGSTNDIDAKYEKLCNEITEQFNAYMSKEEQYLTFGENGLILGAITSDEDGNKTESQFKTLINNNGMYFLDSDDPVAWITNKQLYIKNAIIRDTLYFGNFFFSPHSDEDGGFSITWQQ